MEHLTEIPNFPKGYYPESQFPEYPNPIFPNPYFPEGILSRISIFPKGHCPESLFSRRDIVPNSHFPEGTFSRIPLSRRDIVPNSYFPKALFSGNNYSSSSFLWERFNHHCSQERLFHHHRSFENDFSIVLVEQFSHTILYWLRCCGAVYTP